MTLMPVAVGLDRPPLIQTPLQKIFSRYTQTGHTVERNDGATS